MLLLEHRWLEQISDTSVMKAGPVIDFYLYHLLEAKWHLCYEGRSCYRLLLREASGTNKWHFCYEGRSCYRLLLKSSASASAKWHLCYEGQSCYRLLLRKLELFLLDPWVTLLLWRSVLLWTVTHNEVIFWESLVDFLKFVCKKKYFYNPLQTS